MMKYIKLYLKYYISLVNFIGDYLFNKKYLKNIKLIIFSKYLKIRLINYFIIL